MLLLLLLLLMLLLLECLIITTPKAILIGTNVLVHALGDVVWKLQVILGSRFVGHDSAHWNTIRAH